MKVATTVAIACLSCVVLAGTSQDVSLLRLERSVYVMGTRATLVVFTPDRAAGVTQLEQMLLSLEQTEAELSTWRAQSALSTLNQQPVGHPLTLSPGVCALWPDLARWHRVTEGAFEPAVGALISAWGLRADGRVPSDRELAGARALTGFSLLHFDPDSCQVVRRRNATMDAGAFGKGEALRRVRQAMPGETPWLVDLGGQVAVSGLEARRSWPVAIADPVRRTTALVEITLQHGSLATSGSSERSIDVAGERLGHILDPRTGRPVYRPESISVWHEDALVADALSTALYVMGPDEALQFAERHALAVLVLVPSGGGNVTGPLARASSTFLQQFEIDPSVRVRQ